MPRITILTGTSRGLGLALAEQLIHLVGHEQSCAQNGNRIISHCGGL